MIGIAYGAELTHVTFKEYDSCEKVIRYVAGLRPRPHVSLGQDNDLTIAPDVLEFLFKRGIVLREDVVKNEKVDKSSPAFQEHNQNPVRPRRRPHGDDPKRIRDMMDGLLHELGLS